MNIEVKAHSELPADYYSLGNIYKFSLQNSLLPINNSKIYYGNDTINSFNLLYSIQGPHLVFWFSGEMCNSCIDFVINKLQITFDDYSENRRIILLVTNLNSKVKENYYGKRTLSCMTPMNLPLEKYHLPFLFILDEDRVSKLLFIPDTSYPELTDAYLNDIKKRYF